MEKKLVLVAVTTLALSASAFAAERCGHVAEMSYGTRVKTQDTKLGTVVEVRLQEGGYPIFIDRPQAIQLASTAMTSGALFCESYKLKVGQQYVDSDTNIQYTIKK